jgi:Zn-dependent protease with chaperone function
MTYELQGYLYDGKSSAREEATLVISRDGFVRCDMLLDESIPLDDIQISSRVGNTARYLDFGENRRFETLDNDTVDSICRQWKPAKHGLADKLERNMAMVFLAVVVTIAGGFAFVKWGIPALSEPVTAMIPEELDLHLGDQTMEVMDENILEKSELSVERQNELREKFYALMPEGKDYLLLFRKVGGMPNAFAVPNGTIVMTDALVKLSEDDKELESILLHEIGHLEERHSVQTLVQQASLALVVTMVIGDVNAASSFLLALPAWLAEAQYSQALETEADDYAYEQMLARGMDTNAFADIMLKLERAMTQEEGEDVASDSQDENYADTATQVLDYLSSHPPTAARIERFQTKTQ